SGYADLAAKLTAGADWILADALGAEPIDPRAWAIVQGGLRDSLADPAGARAGQESAIAPLVEGRMLGGFAMQWAKTSRHAPAAGPHGRRELDAAPAQPHEIGIPRGRLRESFDRAYHIRRRFTVLDVAVRTATRAPLLDALFGPAGIWRIQATPTKILV